MFFSLFYVPFSPPLFCFRFFFSFEVLLFDFPCVFLFFCIFSSLKIIRRSYRGQHDVGCGADGLVPLCFAIFPLHLSKVLCLPCKSDARSHEVLHLPRKIQDLIFQNATPLRKSPHWSPNTSNSCVSCIAPATRNASLQILFKCPTPALVFENATKPSRFSHFWQGAQPATQNGIWTSKRGPYRTLHFFALFDFDMCFAPQRRAPFRHLNFQKCSENSVLCTFWLGNVLRATTARNFSSLSLTTWLRTRRFSEPTFRPSGATNHCSFFLLTLSILWSSLFGSSPLWLFPPLISICPYCRKFDF